MYKHFSIHYIYIYTYTHERTRARTEQTVSSVGASRKRGHERARMWERKRKKASSAFIARLRSQRSVHTDSRTIAHRGEQRTQVCSWCRVKRNTTT